MTGGREWIRQEDRVLRVGWMVKVSEGTCIGGLGVLQRIDGELQYLEAVPY